MGKFNDKICLIIGSSKGIGFEIARHLYDLNAFVIITSRNKQNAKQVAKRINSEFKNLDYFSVDVSNQKSITRFFNQVLRKYPRIDILICNAGIFEPIGAFHKIQFSQHTQTLNTNLIGTMQCCHEIVPTMIKNNSGKIILLSGGGIGGDTPLEHASSYYVSKGALAILAEVLAAELRQFNIQVNAISPGRILTDLTKRTLNLSPDKLGKVLLKANQNLIKTGGQSIRPILDLVTFLSANNLKRLSGKLLSAQWDNLNELTPTTPSWKYTLKRIDGKVYSKKNEKETY